ncbi:MAG: hypothetical protein KME64_27005 [Scytonematopsis contorta HA4267-MV1]|jgi:hypothetical protein|nr:hypothetical protein [Scytonematopsis contorta HA4267-MV1]
MNANRFQKSTFKLIAGIALSSSLVIFTSQVARADRRNFRVINRTSEPIVNLHVSRTNTNDWEEDVLGSDVLNAGESQMITFSGFGQNECYFDIQAKFEDGDVVEERKVNLCETDSYTFTEN